MSGQQTEFLAESRVPGVLNIIPPTPVNEVLSIAEQADRWMHTPGGRHIMRDLYALAAGYVGKWRRTGIPIGIALIWEIERQRIKEVTARAVRICKARGIEIPKDYGYTLNNDRRAYVARHMMARKPEWNGLFELRAVEAENQS